MSPCRLCQSTRVEKILESGDVHGRHVRHGEKKFIVCLCDDCGVVFVADIKTDAPYYSQYYPLGYYENRQDDRTWRAAMISRLEEFSVAMKMRQILSCLSACCTSAKIKILDIGCGEGRFLECLDDARFEKYGLETNKEGAEACRRKKIDIFNGGLSAANFADGFFDVITLWHVVEHLGNPAETLTGIRRILKTDGVFVLSTPNTGSLGYRWGRGLWFHLDTPRHLVLFNRDNLAIFLRKSGFGVVREENCFYDYPLDLFWSLRCSTKRFFVYPLYPFFKIASKETMMMICKKAAFNLERADLPVPMQQRG